MLEQLKQLLHSLGYGVFTRPYELNIVGIRSPGNVPNAFDDAIYVFYTDSTGGWQFKSYAVTTDPGLPYLNTPLSSDGTAILKPGHYRDCYALGLHRGQYMALVQRKPVTVFRDANRDGKMDFLVAKEQTGMYGINIHRAKAKGNTLVVDKFSAGCQVFASAEQFQTFLQLCELHKKRYGNVFTYSLLQGTDPRAAAPAALPQIFPLYPFTSAAA